MAESDRSGQPTTNTPNANPDQISSPLNSTDSEMRIEMEDNDQPAVSLNQYNANSTGAVQQNITSILNQARSELERRTEQTRQWRLSLGAVLQTIRQPPIIAQVPVLQTENSGRNVEESQLNIEDLTPNVRVLLGNEPNNPPNSVHSASTIITLGDSENHVNTTSVHTQNPNTGGSSNNLQNPADQYSNNDRGAGSVGNGQEPNSRGNRSRTQPSIATGRTRNFQTDETALSEMLAQVPELRQFIIAVVRYLPFVLILLIKAFFDNMMTIIIALGLLNAFLMADTSLQKQIARRAQASSLIFTRDILLITMFTIGVSIGDQQKFHNLWLLRPIEGPYTFPSLLRTVWVTDHLLKLITVLLKNFIAILPMRVIHYSRKGRFYMLIESVSQLYRYLAPIQPWLTYLTEAYSPFIKAISGILYMAPKILYLISHLKFFKKALKMFPHKVRYGSIPTRNDIDKAGDQCAICHDSFTVPVLLECNHIFCENCIASWFRNESTCPMCRAKVADDMSWLDGRTTQFIQLF